MDICGTAYDVAGEIVDVGQGVKKFKKGDKVVALLHLLVRGSICSILELFPP